MNLKIEPSKAEEKINEFLVEVGNLLKIKYSEGEESKRDLDVRIRGFVNLAFPDNKEKLRSYTGLVFEIAGREETPEEKQEDYEESLQRMRRHLIAWKEEVELNKSIKVDTTRLDKLNLEITEANLETTRREEVARSKFYGAVIELLDLQRNMIKEKEQVTKAIIEIQKDILDIKDMLTKKRALVFSPLYKHLPQHLNHQKQHPSSQKSK